MHQRKERRGNKNDIRKWKVKLKLKLKGRIENNRASQTQEKEKEKEKEKESMNWREGTEHLLQQAFDDVASQVWRCRASHEVKLEF